MKRRLFIAIEDTKTSLTLPNDNLEKDRKPGGQAAQQRSLVCRWRSLLERNAFKENFNKSGCTQRSKLEEVWPGWVGTYTDMKEWESSAGSPPTSRSLITSRPGERMAAYTQHRTWLGGQLSSWTDGLLLTVSTSRKQWEAFSVRPKQKDWSMPSPSVSQSISQSVH